MSYLQWIGIFLGIPMLVFLLIGPEIFTDHRKIFLKVLLAVLLVGLPTDFTAVNIGLWSFPKGLSGLSLLTIPIEEYLWAGLYSSIVVFLTLYFLKKQNL